MCTYTRSFASFVSFNAYNGSTYTCNKQPDSIFYVFIIEQNL